MAVEYISGGRWRCKCLACGNENKVVRSDVLRHGYIETCGCAKSAQTTRGKRKTNTYIIQTAKGHQIMVDVDDLPILTRHSWFVNSDGYAMAKIKGKSIKMHDFLVGQDREEGMVIDHINRNRLDNRRSNLRIISHKANMNNRKDNIA